MNKLSIYSIVVSILAIAISLVTIGLNIGLQARLH